MNVERGSAFSNQRGAHVSGVAPGRIDEREAWPHLFVTRSAWL
jgi:hypothetical protein